MDIYLADTEPLKDPARFEELLSKMPECRREKVLRMRAGINKRQTLGAGVLLSIVLAERGFTEEQTKTGPYGKPYLPGEERFYFNLSHSGSRVMCVTADSPVGCDVQQICDLSEYRKIAKRFFAPEEVDMIDRVPDDKEREKLFFRLWTLKESFIKASGKGLSLALNRFTVLPSDDGIAVLRGETEEEKASLFELPVGDGYCYAYCLLGETEPVRAETHWIDLAKEPSN